MLIPYVGRPLRGQILSLREKEFIEAATAQGASPFRVMFGELLPNIASSVLVFFTLIIASNILTEAGLSFLGAGVQPPNPSWGTLIADGQDADHHGAVARDHPGHRDRADGALPQRLRRRPARCARPAREGQDRALMLAFVVRRLLGAFLVLIAVSFITYLIFVKIPGGDPAPRIAGRTATDANIADIREKLHLDDPFYEQYWGMMQSLFTGEPEVVREPARRRGRDQDRAFPATFSLCIGAAIIWLSLRDPRRRHLGRHRGELSDRVITVLALIGISMPVFWLGLIVPLLLRAGPSLRTSYRTANTSR